MLFAYMPIERNGETRVRLCLTADKPDLLAAPVLIDDLFPTNAAVIRVGNEEALVVNQEPGGALVLNAVEPSSIFLTPNVAQLPGMRTKYLRVQAYQDGTYKTSHSRDKSKWDDWVPNRERS